MKKLNKEFGKHYLIEYSDCDPAMTGKVEILKPYFLKAARLSGATLLDDCFHQFEPAGVSGIIFIAESHFSIHSWPEDRYVGVDILTCGQMDVQIAIESMQKDFGAKQVNVQVIPRGV